MKCKSCKGSGKQTISMQTMQDDGSFKTEPSLEIDCMHCDGTGEMDKEQKETYNYAQNMWCNCGNPSGKSNYHPDGKGKWVSKHHYTCDDCDHVTQIG